jgi:hypothetical protein
MNGKSTRLDTLSLTGETGSQQRHKWPVVILTLLIIFILLLPSSRADAVMGGNGLMWTVWQSAPV